jgi:hypothetical protein
MPRNRTLYNVLALFAGPSPSTGNHFAYVTGTGFVNQSFGGGTGTAFGVVPSGVTSKITYIPSNTLATLSGTSFAFYTGITGAAAGNLVVAQNILNSGLHNRIYQVARVQNFDESFTRNLTDVTQFGNLAPIDRIEIEQPDITASFSYYLTDGSQEKLLGLTVNGSGEAFTASCLSGFISKSTDDRNYYLMITDDGYDAVGYVGGKTGIVAIGNAFLNSYKVNASVGELPTADVELQGLNLRVYGTGALGSNIDIQVPAINPIDGSTISNSFFRTPSALTSNYDSLPIALQPGDITLNIPNTGLFAFDGSDVKLQSFTLTCGLDRTPLQKLGNRYAFSREINFPLTVSLEITANAGDLISSGANYADLICDNSLKDFLITMKRPGCTTSSATRPNAMVFQFKGGRLITESFSSSVGDSATVNATFEAQIGGINDTTKGIFISGSYPTGAFVVGN